MAAVRAKARQTFFVEDYGGYNLAGINAAIVAASAVAGDVRFRGSGNLDITQTSVGDVVKMRAGVRLIGDRSVVLRPTGFNYPCIVFANAPRAEVWGLTIMKHGSAAGAITNTTDILTLDGSALDQQAAYNAWSSPAFDTTGSVRNHRPTRDMAGAILIAGSDDAAVRGVRFDSDQATERGFWSSNIFIESSPNNEIQSGITIEDCQFNKARFGVLTPQVKNFTFQRNSWNGVYWNWYDGAVAGGQGHMLYITSGDAANLPPGTDNLIANCEDRSTRYANTGGSGSYIYYFEPTIKARSQVRMTCRDMLLLRDTGGLDFFNLKDCVTRNIYIDMSTAPAVGGAAGVAQPAQGFRLSRSGYPPGYTDADWGGNTWDNIIFKDIPDAVALGNAYVASLELGGYNVTTPIHNGDVWTNIQFWLRTADQTSANLDVNRLQGTGCSWGTADKPVFVGRRDSANSWASDQKVLTLYAYSGSCSLYASVDAPSSRFPVGHPPVINAPSNTLSGNTINGVSAPPNTTVTFSAAVTSPSV